jgi:hypothetical protein
MKIVTVTFKNGKVEIKTTGFVGADCLAATKQLEADLGLEVESDQKTPEFYQQAQVTAKVKQ